MTLAQAKREAKARRMKGEDVKILEHATIYTQPGRGVAVSLTYTVEAR